MMISYAQNFEDVILNRIFANRMDGFYVDIGVWHPTLDSVTKHFYDLGWHGVNVEALPEQYELIKRERPRDVNVHSAVSSQAGPVRFFRIPHTGLSTMRQDLALRHQSAGWIPEEVEVSTITLRSVCERHSNGGEIDFMKIDVEGAELDVIQSGDWTLYRPRVLLIEAVEPNCSTPAHADWEPLILKVEYDLVYFDGLNRWYVRREDAHLSACFHSPANPIDDFRLAANVDLERRLSSAMKKADRLDQLGKTLLGRIALRLLP